MLERILVFLPTFLNQKPRPKARLMQILNFFCFFFFFVSTLHALGLAKDKSLSGMDGERRAE